MVSSKYCVYVLVKPREVKIVEKAKKTQPAMIQVDNALDGGARQHSMCLSLIPERADENEEHRKKC